VLPVLLCALAMVLWPITRPAPTPADPRATVTTSLLNEWGSVSVSTETSLMGLVIIAGALGSYIHSATSFADFAGNRRLGRSWVWWYVLRSFIGLSLAMVFYFVVRGGLLSGAASATDINPFGVAAVSALVGMFSKQATDKLREVFDTLFKTDRPVERAGALANPTPDIQSIAPTSGLVGGAVTLTITGDHFIPKSVVRFKGIDIETTYISPTQLRVEIPAQLIAAPGAAEVTVYNPPPGGGASTAAIFTIT
jgi:hypothetical protein